MNSHNFYFWVLLAAAVFGHYTDAPRVVNTVFLCSAALCAVIGELIDAIKGKP